LQCNGYAPWSELSATVNGGCELRQSRAIKGEIDPDGHADKVGAG